MFSSFAHKFIPVTQKVIPKGSISWSTSLVHNFCDMLLAQTSTRGTQSYSWWLRADKANSDLWNHRACAMPQAGRMELSCFYERSYLMALDICSGSRGKKGENKEGERAEEGIIRIESSCLSYTSLRLLSWSQVAKHQRGHAWLLWGVWLDWTLQLDFNSSEKKCMALRSEWPGSGPASLFLYNLQQVKPASTLPPVGWGWRGVNVPSLEGWLLSFHNTYKHLAHDRYSINVYSLLFPPFQRPHCPSKADPWSWCEGNVDINTWII